MRRLYQASHEGCRVSVIENIPKANVLLDYGCADGELTVRFAARAGAGRAMGVEIYEPLASAASDRGIAIVATEDLADGSVDVVTANQVIEHLADTDRFVREMYRVLRAGGTLVVSTNNLASWHNIVALVLGAQPFPADVSSNPDIGKLVPFTGGDTGRWSSWTHLRIFSYRALQEIVKTHGFKVVRTQGIGYYPFPGRTARAMARIDPRHAAYLTVTCTKPG